MTPRELDEYKALRDTIRDRGTARHWVVMVGFASWAVLALTVSALAAAPVATLVPLFLLAVTFEVVYSLHTGVERVGRYLQVFYESEPCEAAWEHVAMAYGRTFGGGGLDGLFSPLFWVAALLNLVPAALTGPVLVEWLVVGAGHLLFALRVWSARTGAARQRTLDLERFQTLRDQRRR